MNQNVLRKTSLPWAKGRCQNMPQILPFTQWLKFCALCVRCTAPTAIGRCPMEANKEHLAFRAWLCYIGRYRNSSPRPSSGKETEKKILWMLFWFVDNSNWILSRLCLNSLQWLCLTFWIQSTMPCLVLVCLTAGGSHSHTRNTYRDTSQAFLIPASRSAWLPFSLSDEASA